MKRNREKATSENGPYSSITVHIGSCPSELKSVFLNTKTRKIKKKIKNLYHYNPELKNVLQNLIHQLRIYEKKNNGHVIA